MKPRKAKQRIAGKKVFDAKKRSETEGVKQVKYSKRIHAGISKRLLPESEISPWHRTAVIMKNGILLEVPVRPLSETKGMIPRLNNKGLRDKGGSDVEHRYGRQEARRQQKQVRRKQGQEDQ